MNFRYGAVLKVTRRDTLEEIDTQLKLMSQCGMNTVVIWPAAFWWEEKSEGYPFNTGKKILKMAGRYGIRVIMELAGQLTSSEYAPDFLIKKEYYATTEDGHREYGQSAYGFLNYFDPEVNELVCSHFASAARAYRDEPALLGYDIFNETMFRSFDAYTEEEFRNWLKEKYETVDRLNEVWERTYSDWSQVGFEKWKWMSIVPEADKFAFRKAAVGRFLKKWRAAVECEDQGHLIVADNIHSMVAPGCNYERPQDDFDLKRTVGNIGMSFYPKQVGGTMEDAQRWEVFDAFYAASNREGFYVAEMQTHNQALFNPTTAVRPYELKRWCYESYAAGAKGITYWMWRPFDMGQQTFARGIVDYKGRPTVRYATALEISEEIGKFDIIKPIRSAYGLLYDPENEDFQRRLTCGYPVDQEVYLKSVFGAYKALFEAGLRPDIITFDELNDYRYVFATNQILVDDIRRKKLETFVARGGRLIIDGKFGVVNADSIVNRNVPGDITGEDFSDTDYEGLEFTYKGVSLHGGMSRDIVMLTGGTVEAAFGDGAPAIVENRVGSGCVTTVNTHLFYGYMLTNDKSVPELFVKIFGGNMENVKVRFAGNDEYVVCFMFNYGSEKADAKASVEIEGHNYSFSTVIDGNDSVILAKRRSEYDL